jgi:hypothetical protein
MIVGPNHMPSCGQEGVLRGTANAIPFDRPHKHALNTGQCDPKCRLDSYLSYCFHYILFTLSVAGAPKEIAK